MESRITRSLIATALIVGAVALAYGVATSSLTSLLELYSPGTLLSIALLTAGWAISAVRLKILVESTVKRRLPLVEYLAVRLIGGLMASLTPSAIGGEPARAYYVSRRTGIPLTESYAIVIYEVYYDVVAVSVIAVFASIKLLPLSTPVLLVSLFSATAWLYASIRVSSTGRLRHLDPEPEENKGFLGRITGRLRRYYFKFAESYSRVAAGTPLSVKIVLWLLTLVYNTLWGLAVIPLQQHCTLGDILRSVEAYYLMQSFSMLPTPGGSGAAEYALSLLLDPSTVLKYRVLYYYYNVLLGVVALLLYEKLAAGG
ncbi:MAG: lysylphosphatidylglycerol synthase transmembrane domain-containing protein [Desulfurococcus sp.]|nr:lysylphosphatidylglycerol synthase transmembrane domain-containing protein [Desulfurococcus sp.]